MSLDFITAVVQKDNEIRVQDLQQDHDRANLDQAIAAFIEVWERTWSDLKPKFNK